MLISWLKKEAPKMGWWERNVVDRVSANTEMDKWKRQQAFNTNQDQHKQRIQKDMPMVYSPEVQQRIINQSLNDRQARFDALNNMGQSGFIRDRIDSSTPEDRMQRLKRSMPESYLEEQNARGNKRPIENPFGQILTGIPRFSNTLGSSVINSGETVRGGIADITNNEQALAASLDRQRRIRDIVGNPQFGVFGVGTIFDSPEEMTSLGNLEIAKRLGLTTAQAATEAIPFARITRPVMIGGKIVGNTMRAGGKVIPTTSLAGRTLNTASLAERGASGLGARALTNAAIDLPSGAIDSVARQYSDTGQVDPMTTLIGAGMGLGLGQTQMLPSYLRAAGGTKTANKVKVTASNADAKLATRYNASAKALQDQYNQLNKQWQKAPPQARKQIEKAIKMNRQEYGRVTQGGFIGGVGAKGYADAMKGKRVFEGVDGKPRFEVDDSGAKIKNPKAKTAGELLDHPQLFENYPHLKNVGVEITNLPANTSGKFDGRTIFINENRSQSDQLKTLVHELQHSIQETEGFASGGNPKMRDEAMRVANVEKSRLDNLPIVKEWMDTQNAILLDKTKTTAQKKILFDKNRIEFEKNPDFNKWLESNQKVSRLEGDVGAEQYYKKLAGEAEARAVEKRMDMPMSERYVADKTKHADYVGSHQAPTRGDDNYHAPASDVTGGAGMFPDDIYTDPRAYSYYGHGGDARTIAMDKKSIDLIRAIKDKPDAEVTIYRAVPKGKADKINPGDWVTLNKDYALQHSSSQFDGKGDIIEMKVKADEIYTDGNSVHEFGYDPRPTKQSTFYDSLDVPKQDLIIRNGDGKAMSIDDTHRTWQELMNTTEKPLTEYKVGDKVTTDTMYGQVTGKITKVPNFAEDFRIKGNNFKIKLDKPLELPNGRKSPDTITADGRHFSSGGKAMSIDPLESLKQEARTDTSKLATNVLQNEEIVRSVMNGGVFKMRLDNGKVVAFGDKSILGRVGNGIGEDVTDVIPVTIGRGKSGTASTGQPRLILENQNALIQLKQALGETIEKKQTVSERLREKWGEPATQSQPPKSPLAVEKNIGGTLRPDKSPEPFKNPAIQSEMSPDRAARTQANVDEMKAFMNSGKSTYDKDIPTPKKKQTTKAMNRQDFNDEAMRIRDNLKTGEVGYIQDGNQKFEISRDNARAKLVTKPTLQDALEGKSTKVSGQTTQKQASLNQSQPVKQDLSVQDNLGKVPTQQKQGQKLRVQLKEGKPLSKISSDDNIPDVDTYVKSQVAKQEAPPMKTGLIKKAKRTFIDSLAPAEDNFRQLAKEGKISQETLEDIIVKNGKSLRAGTAANMNLVDSGLVDLIHKMPKQDYDNFGQVLIAQHSADLRLNGIETGRSAKVDAEILKKYGAQYKAEIKQFRKASNFVLDNAVKSQLISKETATMLRQKYPNYVPMNRVIEELESKGSFGSKQIASIGRQTVVRKIKGSKRVVENPMESMIAKVQDMTRQSLRNDASLAWIDTLKSTGDAKLVKGDVKAGESTISVIRNGQKEIYLVDPQMELAAKGLTKEQMGAITNMARKVSRVFKTGTTGVNLPFIVTNLARDQQTALLNMSKGEIEVFRQAPAAIMETLKHGDLYKEAVKQGAISTSFDLTKPNLKRTAENIRKKGASLGVFDRVEDVIGRSEEFTRLQQYKATKEYWLKKGLGENDAINKATLAAQQNSADFARAGDLGQILNAWLPYTNAGVQGTRSYLRAAAKNPKRYATKAGAMLIMPTVMTALWNTENEERKAVYDDISEFEKQANTIIVTPWAKKNEEGQWEGLVKIPKPPGISALLFPIEKGVASMKGLDPVGFGDVVKGVLGFASPVGDNASSAISTITPQIIKPAVETVINRNLFTGRDVVPFYLKNKPANEQAYKQTSGTSRAIGSVTNTSPLAIEHLLRGYTGEVGLQALNASDNLLNKAGIIPEEQIGGRSIPKGFTRRFTEAYDKPDSTVSKGSSTGNVKTKNDGKSDGDFFGVNDREKLLEQYKAGGKLSDVQKRVAKTLDELPQGLSKESQDELVRESGFKTDVSKKYYNKIGNKLKLETARFERDSLAGTLSKADEFSKAKDIAKLTIAQNYGDDTYNMYSLALYEIESIANDDMYAKLLAYDKELYENDLISTPKFKANKNAVSKSGRRATGGRKGSKLTKADLDPLLQAYKQGAYIKTPETGSAPSVAKVAPTPVRLAQYSKSRMKTANKGRVTKGRRYI